MKKNFTKILFAIGFLIFIFPFVLRLISYFNQTTAVYNYKSEISNMSEEEKKNKQKELSDYNDKLSDEKPIVSMGEEIQQSNSGVSSFDFLKAGNVVGNLIIPVINVDLPIYDGLEENNLEKGVVHLDNTSYPTGQNNTHCVLAGHSGLTRAKILDDLDKVNIEDEFQIEYMGDITYYQVADIKIVLPYETESLQIIDDETLVTLVTCTPKGINTHRLVVTGRKIEKIEEVLSRKDKIINFIKQYYPYMILISIIAIIITITITKKKNNKKRKIYITFIPDKTYSLYTVIHPLHLVTSIVLQENTIGEEEKVEFTKSIVGKYRIAETKIKRKN